MDLQSGQLVRRQAAERRARWTAQPQRDIRWLTTPSRPPVRLAGRRARPGEVRGR